MGFELGGIGNLTGPYAPPSQVSIVWSFSDKLIYLALVAVIWLLLNFIVSLPDGEGEKHETEDN